jgi:hypothetical protein
MSRLQTSHSEMAIFGPFLTFTIGRRPLTFSARQNATILRISQRTRPFALAGSLSLTHAHQLADFSTENHVKSRLRVMRIFPHSCRAEIQGIPGWPGQGLRK